MTGVQSKGMHFLPALRTTLYRAAVLAGQQHQKPIAYGDPRSPRPDITRTMSGMSGRCLPGATRTDTDTTPWGVRMSGCPAHLRVARSKAVPNHDCRWVRLTRLSCVPRDQFV